MDRLRGGSDIWFFTLLFYDYILAMIWFFGHRYVRHHPEAILFRDVMSYLLGRLSR
jgi:hypothetical protein